MQLAISSNFPRERNIMEGPPPTIFTAALKSVLAWGTGFSAVIIAGLKLFGIVSTNKMKTMGRLFERVSELERRVDENRDKANEDREKYESDGRVYRNRIGELTEKIETLETLARSLQNQNDGQAVQIQEQAGKIAIILKERDEAIAERERLSLLLKAGSPHFQVVQVVQDVVIPPTP